MTLSSKMDSQLDKNNMNLYKCQLMYQKYTNLQHQMDSLHNCMMNTIAAWNTCKLPNNDWFVQVDIQVKDWLDNIDKIKTEIEQYADWLADREKKHRIDFSNILYYDEYDNEIYLKDDD